MESSLQFDFAAASIDIRRMLPKWTAPEQPEKHGYSSKTRDRFYCSSCVRSRSCALLIFGSSSRPLCSLWLPVARDDFCGSLRLVLEGRLSATSMKSCSSLLLLFLVTSCKDCKACTSRLYSLCLDFQPKPLRSFQIQLIAATSRPTTGSIFLLPYWDVSNVCI